MPDDVFVACTLPDPAQAPFAARFDCRFNQHGRTLAPAELVANCGAAAGLVVTATDAVSSATILALPDSVRVLATYSVGHEHVDVAAARERGIAVLSTPDVLSGVGAWRRSGSLMQIARLRGWHAVQAQCCPPSPHPEAALPCHELACL